MKLPLFNNQGEKIADVTFEVSKNASEVNKALVSQALRVEANHIFSKNGKAKTRAEVSGGGKKPFKQKGTGRARAGSNRSPIWKGGGVTFGPSGISRVLRIPRKMRALAMLQLLVSKTKEIAVVDDFSLKTGKTKDASAAIEKIAPSRRAIIIYSTGEKERIKPYSNLVNLEFLSTNNLLLSDLVKSRKFLFSKKAFEEISARLKNV